MNLRQFIQLQQCEKDLYNLFRKEEWFVEIRLVLVSDNEAQLVIKTDKDNVDEIRNIIIENVSESVVSFIITRKDRSIQEKLRDIAESIGKLDISKRSCGYNSSMLRITVKGDEQDRQRVYDQVKHLFDEETLQLLSITVDNSVWTSRKL